MKTKIFVTIIVAATLSLGAYYVLSNKIDKKSITKNRNSIIGSWKIDTAYNNDSSKLNLLTLAFLDSTTVIKFNADSTLQFNFAKEKETQHYYLSNDSLFVKEDSTYNVELVKFVNDSSISLTAKDSTVIILKKL